ncbi:H-2 class II histocompatibility antigen, E-S beta chain-like [Rana temporaria]|uniref:H-2 class II histocompatibility antigen, E-S beta chain-like n=1 Tax=Rana temporaria TaxID=8407 RepID=UPI001AACECEC|nr:H-2 class II histocompatibility antigen, E-S beta chain-like [Rana temporaria]
MLNQVTPTLLYFMIMTLFHYTCYIFEWLSITSSTCSKMKAVLFFFSTVLLLQTDIIHGEYRAEPADYVIEGKDECHYMNGTQRVKFLRRYFYNQEEIVYFDSDVGYYIAKTEIGRPDAEYWNKNKDIIEQLKAYVQTFCIHNYGVSENVGITGRRVKPTIRISLRHEDPHSEYHMLACNVNGFYPSEIEVKWYRNGVEETAQVQSTDIFQNGDWTFQILVMLETEITKGDTFTCEVLHSSLETPARVDWHPQESDSARKKVVTGIVGFVLGAILIIAGVFVYMRGRKAQLLFRGPQTEHFIHT